MTAYIVQLFGPVFMQPPREDQTILVAVSKALQRYMCTEEVQTYPDDGLVRWVMAALA